MGSEDFYANVPGLAKASGTLYNRKTDAETTTKSLKENVLAAVQTLGHADLVTKGGTFLDNYITPHANNLPNEIGKAGETGHNTAATVRGSDEDGAARVKQSTDKQVTLRPINDRNIPI